MTLPKGSKCSEETKKKMSKTAKERFKDKTNHPCYGKPCSEETKRKIGLANKGKKFSKEHLRKLSEAHMGQITWQKGKVCPQLRGENNGNWQGGKTEKNRLIRGRIEFRLWREAVFARDNWACQKCGARSGKKKGIFLHPHHIQNFAEWPELRFAIDNGITFCKNCHQEFHKIYSKKNNNGKQLKEFIRNADDNL